MSTYSKLPPGKSYADQLREDDAEQARAKKRGAKKRPGKVVAAVATGSLPVLRGEIIQVAEHLEELAAGLKSKMAGFRKSGDVLDEVEHYRGHQVTMHCAAELRRHAKSAPTAWPEENNPGQTPEGRSPGGCL